jgi:hypothetical protein
MTTIINTETNFMKLREWVQIDKLGWGGVSYKPNAIPILEQNLDKVIWWALSSNPNAIPILEKNLHKVDWIGLSLHH